MPQPNYRPIPPLTTEIIKRFWYNVDKRGRSDCWHWTGQLTNGYGSMIIDGEMFYAIRILHVIMNGEDPGEDMVVRHTCDVPSCCNFFHHVLGSHQQNMHDAFVRGRFASGERNEVHSRTESVGSARSNAKLVEADVLCIRERYAAGESCHAIAKDYPVNQTRIQTIVRGKQWTHVGGPIVTGNLPRAGERSGKNILNDASVLEILRKRKEGATIPSLCVEYGVTQGSITAIIYGQTWKHLNGDAEIPKKQLSKEDVIEIRSLYATGKRSMQSLADEYGMSRSSINNIANRITWTEVE